jgi:protein-tyrosine phosphatase
MEYIDIHSHILPQIDDGANDIEESLGLARMALENGVKQIIATPHMGGRFPILSKDFIDKQVARLNSVLKEQAMDVRIYPGGEISTSMEIVDLADNGRLIRLADSDYTLIDLPFNEIPIYLSTLIFDLKLRSITPILAHVERNTEIQRDPYLLEPLLNQGAIAQVNSTSFSGILGGAARKCAIELLKRDFINVVASDSHSYGGRNPNFKETAQIVQKYVGRQKTKQLFTEIPCKILGL